MVSKAHAIIANYQIPLSIVYTMVGLFSIQEKMQGTEVSVPCMMFIWLKDPRLYVKW